MTRATFKNFLNRKGLHILGLNSGTSVDGVDLALIRFLPGKSRPDVEFMAGRIIPYPRRIKSSLERILQERTADLAELGRIDIAYGAFLGKTAVKFLNDNRCKADLIASHGQTIGHYPAKEKTLGYNVGTTIQIGDGNAIASCTGLPVVSDFRRADIALGGEGAPLTPFVNHLLFGDRQKSRIIVNIGGIANFSYHPAGSAAAKVKGGDCGPGNVLSDMACRLLFHKDFDRNGALAARGKVYEDIVEAIVQANGKRKVSAGREQFDHHLMARMVHMSRRLKADKHDLLAAINDAAVRLIYRSLAGYLKDPHLDGLYITGGGRRNIDMVERLRKLCGPIPVWPIEALGYDGDFLEAVSFAVLGGCYVHGIASTMPQITGSGKGGVAGKMAWPPLK